jgi:PEP-CTERM motif-containing protein
MKSSTTLVTSALVAAATFAIPQVASAGLFDSGIPVGWTCIGNCGTSGADGVVPLAPGGGSQYGWISTFQQVPVMDGGTLPGIAPDPSGDRETNGSRITSPSFSATAGQNLQFSFNYVTSDGTPTFPDYTWARLLDGTATNQVAILFTARTVPSPGNIVPGNGMPAPAATLTPANVPILLGTTWSPLGPSSGACFGGEGQGCGHSGWVQSNFTVANAGNYVLQFGVTNWSDTLFDSGLAFDGITIGGTPIGQEPGPGPGPVTGVPEPGSLALLGLSLAAFAGTRRRSVKS